MMPRPLCGCQYVVVRLRPCPDSPKSQNMTTLALHRSAEQQIKRNPQFKDKNPVPRYPNIIHNFVHSYCHLDVSYICLQVAVRDSSFARLLCCCCSKP